MGLGQGGAMEELHRMQNHMLQKGLIATSLRRSSTVLNDIELSCGVARNGIDRTKSVLRLSRVSRACTLHQGAILAVNGDQ